MKKCLFVLVLLSCTSSLKAWWDPGHLVVAMIAYERLTPAAKARVDALTAVLQRDYPYANHFITTGPWPDDLKAEGVRSYDSWHYTNLPYNPDGVALPPQPEVDVIWAVNQCNSVLRSSLSREVDKARHLGFLVHFVGDLHQPLHSTTVYSDENPSGNLGGNEFLLQGSWRNLHALWDDGCGFLSAYNDISPYGQPKEALTAEEIDRIRQVAQSLVREFPEESMAGLADQLDPDFWALESHKLALRNGYRGINGQDERGRTVYLESGGTPSELYLTNAQGVVRRQLTLAGYRLARMLNVVFKE